VFKFLKQELPVMEHGGGGVGPGQDLVYNFIKVGERVPGAEGLVGWRRRGLD
jgi:hypothetical protein